MVVGWTRNGDSKKKSLGVMLEQPFSIFLPGGTLEIMFRSQGAPV
jgi:hypothetical protein